MEQLPCSTRIPGEVALTCECVQQSCEKIDLESHSLVFAFDNVLILVLNTCYT